MKHTIVRARELRANATTTERFLWQHLRLRQIDGYKFRRQRPVGPYVVDFICLEKRLVIEVDGGQHNTKDLKMQSEKPGCDRKVTRCLGSGTMKF